MDHFKTCTKCKESKSSVEFYRRSDRKGRPLNSHCKACVYSYGRAWAKSDDGKVYKNEYNRKRRKYYQSHQLATALRKRLRQAIKSTKAGSAVRDLGCTVEQLKVHLESKFQNGMTWDNYGEWHVDHILPLNAFDLSIRDHVLIACHYLNLRPLWASENILKSDVLPSEEEMDALIKSIVDARGL